MVKFITRRAAASALAVTVATARAARGDPSALESCAAGRQPDLVRRTTRYRNGGTVRPRVHRRIPGHHGGGDPHHRTGGLPAPAARHQEPHAALRRVQRHRHLAHADTEGATGADPIHAGQRHGHARAVRRAVGRRLVLCHQCRALGADPQPRQGRRRCGAEGVDRSARSSVERTALGRPSGIQRRRRRLVAGDAETLRLAVLRGAGEEQSARRPLDAGYRDAC